MTDQSFAEQWQEANQIEGMAVLKEGEATPLSKCILILKVANQDYRFAMSHADLASMLRTLLCQVDPTPEQQIVALLEKFRDDDYARRANVAKTMDEMNEFLASQRQSR